jgi:hypothetical protein
MSENTARLRGGKNFEKFTEVIDQILSVTYNELQARLKTEKRQRMQKQRQKKGVKIVRNRHDN